MSLKSVDTFLHKPDVGLLIIRVVVGVVMVVFGVNKFMGGQARLEGLGQAIGVFGITFWPLFWGFMAALTETVGGFLLVIGFLFRPAAFFLFFTLLVAVATKWGGPFQEMAFPLVMVALFAGLLFTGPGRFQVKAGG
jgi:putative oxidoreductase